MWPEAIFRLNRLQLKWQEDILMQNSIPLHGFIQIALVVRDMDSTLDAWCALFNVPRPDVRITKAEPNPGETYRGQTACYGLKFAVIDFRDRGFVIEVHEPDENPSTFREFLDKHGNGVHHIGFQVGDARDAVLNELAGLGYDVTRTVGVYPGGSWTIVDSEDSLGVNLNIKPHP
jgi:catechol 2,3-dioxygenase-like lactoylglutathione lyase family enzyme